MSNIKILDTLKYDVEDYSKINDIITSIINDTTLGKNNNNFFLQAAKNKKIDVNTAFDIAYNWREITKTFLFTAIKGLGCLAEKIGQEENPNPKLLSVLQTSFSIISDDLNNSHTIFKKSAPLGPKGAHYKWWEDSILNPLAQLVRSKKSNLSNGTIMLKKKMYELSRSYLGAAVQLRVVEAIALDICIAFFNLFSNVEYQGRQFFTSSDLAWITSHMKAEQIHHEQVCNIFSGMSGIATTQDEKKELLLLVQEYSNSWKVTLEDFSIYLNIPE